MTRRYPAYRDSGVEWLGEVPEGWGVLKLKTLLSLNTGGVWGEDPDGVSDTVVLRSTDQTEAGKWKIEDPALRKLSEKEAGQARLVAGDLLVTKSSGSSKHIGKTTLVDDRVGSLNPCYSNFMQRLRPNGTVNARLLWYFLNSNLAREQLDLVSNSTTGLANLNGTMLGELVLPVAPRVEQATIASFLDLETAKIDMLVDEQRRLITLLREKRQAVISHAVTKGLNPAAPMKPSGVDWLGDVPKGWELKRLKNVVPSVTVGIVVEPSKYYVEAGVPALRSLNVRPGRITVDNLVFISDEANQLQAKSKLNVGDIVAVRTGQPGTCAVVTEEFDGCNCIDLIIIRRPTSSDSHYMFWYLNSDYALRQFSEGSGGAIQLHFNVSTANELLICVPPLDEQQDISAYLSSAISSLDQLVETVETAITLLQERCAALISAAVTGKIDVRDLAPARTEAA